MKRVVVAALALALSATAVGNDFKFRYSAQDLATPEQVEHLHARLKREAAEFCRYEYQKQIRAVRICKSIILSDTVGQIDSPQLTAHLEGASGPAG